MCYFIILLERDDNGMCFRLSIKSVQKVLYNFQILKALIFNCFEFCNYYQRKQMDINITHK